MFQRYALYFVPDGPWGDAGAAWLGWDTRHGRAIAQTDVRQADLTARPRKYGFHATLKAPFRLANGATRDSLETAIAALARSLKPVPLASLQVSQIGRFFAMTAPGEQAALIDLSSAVVRDLDRLRAPLTEADLKRRRAARLTDRQDALLQAWGYPYVLDEFRFHLTLTGPVRDAPDPLPTIHAHFKDAAEHALILDSLSLVGERDDGRFEQIARVEIGA